MASVNKNKVEFKEPNLLSNRKIEVIVSIAKYLEQHREVRKSYLRDITGTRARTFEEALAFLLRLSLVTVQSRYPPRRKNKQGKGRKLKYVMWKHFESKEVVESIESLIAFKDFDLEKYPIRSLDKYNEEQIDLLKKYLFRIERKAKTPSINKLNRIFGLLNVELGCPINSMRTIYRMKTEDIFGCVQKLMNQGKAEIGLSLKTSRIELYKDSNWVFAHTRWKCENCGKWNVGSNTKFCGGCGDRREE